MGLTCYGYTRSQTYARTMRAATTGGPACGSGRYGRPLTPSTAQFQ